LYVSPLKALAIDIERNLMKPVEEMGLPVTVENLTGDTPNAKRQRQKLNPPDILLTTPDQGMRSSVERIEISGLAPPSTTTR
ncbi:DEAD/DEAH box helicase, partial [Rhizobium leguminosarum]|uniref:DEAD/DEAH box helicase n=1 Tax=Rhizobium leguminosarum TaxID=384 RepID=UPI003F9BA0F7